MGHREVVELVDVWAYYDGTPALEGINPEQAAVLRLLANEASYREISEALGIPKGTVMSRLYYARRRVQQLLVEAGVVAERGEER